MKSLIAALLLIASFNAFAVIAPECKDQKGNVLQGTMAALKDLMYGNGKYRPQAYVTGVITSIGQEDHQGLQHQKFAIKVSDGKTDVKLQIVTNLEFGRIPLEIGKTISVCGEFLKAQGGMIHWTHFDPHGGHADGFTILDGKMYGDTETPIKNNF